MKIREVDKVEITTLQDNYIDLLMRDNSAVVSRAIPLKDMEVKNSVLAEHGFSALVSVSAGEAVRSILFDFGFSAHGAAFNARASGPGPFGRGGHRPFARPPRPRGRHRGAFRPHQEKGDPARPPPGGVQEPALYQVLRGVQGQVSSADAPEGRRTRAFRRSETTAPYGLLDDAVLFLGEVPRKTDFETGVPNFFYQKDGQETWDDLADDSAIVMNVRGKGLVVISGCAHSGIVNTVTYARQTTGVDTVHAIMGGFHLSGPGMEPLVEKTTEGLKQFNPAYVIPTHCTGRYAIGAIEREMPDSFILNMVGTKLTFS